MVIVDPDGTEVYRYPCLDFADRTNDDDIWSTLESLALPPADFGAYFRGIMFGAVAIGRRVHDDESRALAKEHRQMSRSNLEAWETWRPAAK